MKIIKRVVKVSQSLAIVIDKKYLKKAKIKKGDWVVAEIKKFKGKLD